MPQPCPLCGAPVPTPPGGGRRKYCATCSPPRPSTKVTTSTDLATVTILPTPPTSVADATLRELTAAGLVESVGGQLLLTLARVMDDPAQTASGVASAAKVFAELFDRSVTQVKPREDNLTAIRDRARAKFPDRHRR